MQRAALIILYVSLTRGREHAADRVRDGLLGSASPTLLRSHRILNVF